MAHRYDLLPVDRPLVATADRDGFTPADQTLLMMELRRATNAIAEQYQRRDELLAAVAKSDALSRPDIGAAAGLAESRVNQIIRELKTARTREAKANDSTARIAEILDRTTPTTPTSERTTP